MQRILTLLSAACLLGISAGAAAQAPCAVPVESYLSDLTGAPFNGSLDVEVTFYDGPGVGSVAMDCRVASRVTVANGWLRLMMDACSLPEPGPSGCGVMTITEIIDAGASEGATVWMGIRVGEDATELEPRVQLGAVPYAVYANHAATADEAGHAATADFATSADSATSAASAETADFATSAGSATTADSAETADFATSAGTATSADSATTADFATAAGTATSAESATTADFATNAGNAASADRADVADALDGFSTTGIVREGVAMGGDLDVGRNRVVNQRGETYTTWGTTTCGSGHTRLYSGRVASVVGTGGGSTPFCLSSAVTSTSWIPWDGGMMWRANGSGTGVRGQYSNAPNDFSCAVCEGATYTHWGENACASGYDTVYQGWIASFSGGWSNGWSPGGPICLATTSGGSWINWNDTMVMRALGSSGNNRVHYQNSQDMRCRVCY